MFYQIYLQIPSISLKMQFLTQNTFTEYFLSICSLPFSWVHRFLFLFFLSLHAQPWLQEIASPHHYGHQSNQSPSGEGSCLWWGAFSLGALVGANEELAPCFVRISTEVSSSRNDFKRLISCSNSSLYYCAENLCQMFLPETTGSSENWSSNLVLNFSQYLRVIKYFWLDCLIYLDYQTSGRINDHHFSPSISL